MLIGISFIVCSLIYMLLLCSVYFTKKRRKTTETEIYASLLVLNVIGLILELACCFTVQHMEEIPILNLICNRAYLVYFATFVSLFTIYIYIACSKTEEIDKIGTIKFNKTERIINIVVYTLLLGSVLFLPLQYHNEPDAVYSYGMAANALTIACGIFMILDFINIFMNLKKVKKMKNGEISDPIYDDTTGYYVVVKMIDNNSDAAYKDACDSAIENAQTQEFNTWYQEEEAKHKVKVNTDLWTDVTVGSVTTDIVTVEDLEKMNEDASSDDASSSK